MTLTHILVDFENVQPTAQDIALARGDSLRLWIFRGPGQKKYAADVAEAWQPLGERVQFIRCEKSGRNALDMHIALQLGRLIGPAGPADPPATTPRALAAATRFVVVSKDTDYDPLLLHIRGLGYSASRVASIKAALGDASAPRPGSKAAKAAAATGHAPAAKKVASARKAAPDKQSTAVRSTKQPAARADKHPATVRSEKHPATVRSEKHPATVRADKQPALMRPVKQAQPVPAGKVAKAPRRAALPAMPSQPAAPDHLDKLIANLRDHPKNRPAKRKPLEKFIAARLQGKIAAADVPAIIDDMQRRGVLAISDNRVAYPLWPEAAKAAR